MRPWFETVTDLTLGADVLRRRAYGVIEVAEGQFREIRLRPLPKLVSGPDIVVLGGLRHRYEPGDRCLLYYNQPWRFPKFLALPYIVSARQTSFQTFHRAVEILDHIARLKGVDALLCDVSNVRISRRLLARWGWEPHCRSRYHRHYIKRFYGHYPPVPGWLQPG